MTLQKVTTAESVPPGRVVVVDVDGQAIAVCNAEGALYAINDVCTHDGGALDQGELDGEEIECPRHGARFNVTTGDATQLPAFEPVETPDVRLEGETLQVGVEHR